jgi:tRNA-modifying protein YgfZ
MQARIAVLPDRGIVRVAGEDAEKLLQGVISNDMDLLAMQPAIHSALLTPQGKILFEFFVVGMGGGLLLETARDRIPDLIKRLGMYRLRATVAVEDASGDFSVAAVWGGRFTAAFNATHFDDPRLSALGMRWLLPSALLERLIHGRVQAGEAVQVDASEYHAHRIALGVPEGGKDYAFGDTFPHEANLDLLNGISFTKGCFVGQEVVSRMQHRGGARKRVVIVEADAPLVPGAEIVAGAATIGTVGSVAGQRALALVRLDRAEEAKAKGEPLAAAGVALSIRLPDYLAAAHPAVAP